MDYTKLFRCIKSNVDVDQLQRDIDALMEWSKQWLPIYTVHLVNYKFGELGRYAR